MPTLQCFELAHVPDESIAYLLWATKLKNIEEIFDRQSKYKYQQTCTHYENIKRMDHPFVLYFHGDIKNAKQILIGSIHSKVKFKLFLWTNLNFCFMIAKYSTIYSDVLKCLNNSYFNLMPFLSGFERCAENQNGFAGVFSRQRYRSKRSVWC